MRGKGANILYSKLRHDPLGKKLKKEKEAKIAGERAEKKEKKEALHYLQENRFIAPSDEEFTKAFKSKTPLPRILKRYGITKEEWDTFKKEAFKKYPSRLHMQERFCWQQFIAKTFPEGTRVYKRMLYRTPNGIQTGFGVVVQNSPYQLEVQWTSGDKEARFTDGILFNTDEPSEELCNIVRKAGKERAIEERP